MTGESTCPRIVSVLLLVTLTAAGAAGCRRDTRVTSEGTVTYGGEPVARGLIGFFAESTPASEGATIENGRFVIRSEPGHYRVQIRGARPLPPDRQPPPPAPTCYEDFIPEEFNTGSTLKVEVSPSGPNEFTFDLKPSAGRK